MHGSSEAIKNAISQIKHDEVKPKIILSDIGMVTETDVTLAKASKAVLIAFNVKPSKEAKKLAENENIKKFDNNVAALFAASLPRFCQLSATFWQKIRHMFVTCLALVLYMVSYCPIWSMLL